MLNIDILKNDLEKLGIKKGDILLVRADLGQIGKVDTKEKQDYVNFILDTIGEEGTLVGLSFTNSFFIKKNKNLIFDGKNKSYTGAFVNIMLNHSKALRSQHPTNSYVAIGKYAEYITKDHNEFSGAYEPIRKIIELNGKMLLIGCVSSSPGFTTTHLAEVDLGLHKRIILPSLDGVYYKKNNEIKIFKRKDVGSCSSTFYKFYSFYVKNELLFQGYVGNAYTVLADAKKIYRLDLEILKKNSKITICHNPRCMLCRARRWDNLIDMPIFIIRYLYTKFLKR